MTRRKTSKRPPNVPEAGDRHADPLAVALLELAHLGGLLHPEVDLVAVLADHLQLDVLGLVSHGVGVSVTGVCARWRQSAECRLGKRGGRGAAAQQLFSGFNI